MNEFDLIYQYFQQQPAIDSANISLSKTSNAPSVVKGIGDDAAILQFNANHNSSSDSHHTDYCNGCKIVTCVDTLIQGRHFSENWSQVSKLAFSIGYKSVAVNVSDIAAMGAIPHSILLALALPKRLANITWLDSFSKGLFHACQQFGVQLIGGDTTRNDKLVVSITANGFYNPEAKPIYRSGAQVGDNIYVSGTLGDASFALKHGTDVDNSGETEAADSAAQACHDLTTSFNPNTIKRKIAQQLENRLHMPTPRLQLGQVLAIQKNATAMIDISDGLIQDLTHICRQSGVNMHINLESLPTSSPLQQIALSERLICQLTGGDDYELAFTLPKGVMPPSSHVPITLIGEVVALSEPLDHSQNLSKDNEFETEMKLHYHGVQLTKTNPHPFTVYPDLTGFQHFHNES